MKKQQLYWVQLQTPEDANTLGPFKDKREADYMAEYQRRIALDVFGNFERPHIRAEVVETRV